MISTELIQGGFAGGGFSRNSAGRVKIIDIFRSGSIGDVKNDSCPTRLGDDVEDKMKNFVISWRVFCQYYSVGDNSYPSKLNEKLNDLFISSNELTPSEWVKVVRLINKLPHADFYKLANRILGASDKLHLIIKVIFMNYRDLLERIFRRFLVLQGLDPGLPKLEAKWKALDKKFKIESTSPMLYFSTYFGLTFKNARPKFSTRFSSLDSALKKYKYLGFCRKKPIYRLQVLLDFPVIELLEAINTLDPKSLKSFDFTLLQKVIDEYNQHKHKLKSPPIPESKKFDFLYGDKLRKGHDFEDSLRSHEVEKLPRTGMKVRKFEDTLEGKMKKAMDELIEKLVKYRDDLEKKEEFNVDLVTHLNEINTAIVSIGQ